MEPFHFDPLPVDDDSMTRIELEKLEDEYAMGRRNTAVQIAAESSATNPVIAAATVSLAMETVRC